MIVTSSNSELRSIIVALLNHPLGYPSFMVAQVVPDNESLRLELQEAIGMVRHWALLVTQAAGFITTADVVLISYGFVQKIAGILLLATVMPITLLIIFVVVGSMASRLISLILRLERSLLIRKDSLGATLAEHPFLRPIGIAYGDIEKLDDEKVRELNLASSKRRWLLRPLPIILYTAITIHLGLFIVAFVVFHHRFM
jgi:hypothetical protein